MILVTGNYYLLLHITKISLICNYFNYLLEHLWINSYVNVYKSIIKQSHLLKKHIITQKVYIIEYEYY